MDEKAILKAAESMLDVMQGKELPMREVTIKMEIPESVLSMCETICKEMGLTGHEEEILGNMASQGLLQHLQSIGAGAKSKFIQEKQSESSGGVEDELSKFMDNSSFGQLGEMMTTLNNLTEKFSSLQEMLDGPSQKNSK